MSIGFDRSRKILNDLSKQDRAALLCFLSQSTKESGAWNDPYAAFLDSVALKRALGDRPSQ